MRVLFVSDVTTAGGVDTYILSLALGAMRNGVTIDVLLNDSEGVSDTAARFESAGVRVHRGRLYHRTYSEREQQAAIVKVLRESEPDIAHVVCGIPWSCLEIREAVIRAGTPLIFTEQYVPTGLPMDAALRRRLAAIYRAAAKIICVCNENKHLLRVEYQLPVSDVIVIPNAVSLRANGKLRVFRPSGGRTCLEAVTVARLVHQKGIDCLIRSLPLLSEDTARRLRVVVFGDGPLRDELRELARHLGVATMVEFQGWRDDVVERLAEFDFFVLPSRSEGQPFALLEAMAAGIPVVASAVSGIPEALDHGSCGTLVPPDDPQSLATAMELLAGDPLNAGRLAELAILRIRQHHDLEASVARHLDLWSASSGTR